MVLYQRNARTFLCVDIRSKRTTLRRVVLARMFKEAGLRSPRTQLTKVQIEISMRGRRTEARSHWTPILVPLTVTLRDILAGNLLNDP